MKERNAVLLVEDSPGVRMLVRNIVENLGFAVTEAGNGREGLEQLANFSRKRGRPDLIIADFYMPGMDGLSFIRKVRDRDKHIPILMLTTESRPERIEEARRAGANGWVVKPINIHRFASLLQRFFKPDKCQEKPTERRELIPPPPPPPLTPAKEDPLPKDEALPADESYDIRAMVTQEAHKQFLDDMEDNLEALEQALLAMEKEGGSGALYNLVFRLLHSIKGEADMFGYSWIAAVTHRLEDVFFRVRDDHLAMSPEIVGLSLTVHDLVVRLLDNRCSEEEVRGALAAMKAHLPASEGNEETEGVFAGDRGEPAQEESALPNRPLPRRDSSSGIKILIADDELNNRILLKKMVGVYGDCDMAFNGCETVDAFEAAWADGTPYDLILLDIMMPDMDGQTALKEIRQKEQELEVPPGREVAIIMVTALDSPKEVLEAFYRGYCTDYITKPVDKALLVSKLKEYRLIPE